MTGPRTHHRLTSSLSGLTLIEVVASVALLSTLLVGLLSSHAKHLRQINTAHRTNQAIELTDQLLARWFASDDPLPRDKASRFAENPTLYWRSTVRSQLRDTEWACDTLAIEVFSDDQQQPLLTVVVLDSPEPSVDDEIVQRERDRHAAN